MDTIWHHAELGVKLALIITAALAGTTTVRLTRIALRIFSFVRRPAPLIHTEGEIEPEAFAVSAMATPCDRIPLAPNGLPVFSSITPDDEFRRRLYEAECRFLLQWNQLNVQVRRTRRTARLALWLSFLSFVHGIIPTFRFFAFGGDRSLHVIVLDTVDECLTVFAIQIAVCMAMSCASRFVSDTLEDRRACWVLLFQMWKRPLLARTPAQE